MPGDKYLPGLEGDPSGAVLENWTDADWSKWFETEVVPSRRFKSDDPELVAQYGEGREVDKGLMDAAVALENLATNQMMKPGDFIIPAFGRLSQENKLKFYRGWYRVEHDLDLEDRHQPKPKPRDKWRNRVITGVAVATVITGGFLLTRGGGGNLEWTVTDLVGDIAASWDDVDALDDPDPAGDITVMAVKNEGEDTTVTVRFNGAARDMTLGSRQDLAAGLLIVFPDGRVIDILWGSDKCKISDSSTAGDSVECGWLDEKDLELKIQGWKPIPETNVTFVTYQTAGIGSGSSSDTVELTTD